MISSVLVVDTDLTTHKSIRVAFQPSRIRVESAARTGEVIEYLVRNGGRRTLIVCSLCMPECDGIELIQLLARLSDKPPMLFVANTHPVIVTGAKALARALDFPAAGALRKPLTADSILRKVDTMLLSAHGAGTHHPAMAAAA